MPNDYYLLIGGVNGESQAADMENNIELDSWSFGGSSPASVGGKGLSGGTPSFSDFTCTFKLDSASWQIMKNMCQGTHIASVTFSGRKTGGNNTPYKYLVVTLNNSFVTAFTTTGQPSDIPMASLGIAFEEIQYQYYTQDSKSGQVTLSGAAKYDIKQVQAS